MLERMSDTEYETRKLTLQTRIVREKESQSLKTVSEGYWREITNRFYNFVRFDAELTELDSVEKSDVFDFFKVLPC
jgi:secreted Zn-dependent insulinase-like peptidase